MIGGGDTRMNAIIEAVEILRCAEINFNNLVKMNPALAHHPFYKIAMEQLKAGIEKIDMED